MYILNNWSIKDHESRDGRVRVHLFGKVFGHPRFAPGEVISTSAVTQYRFETDSVVTHSGSEYRLGKADAAACYLTVKNLSRLSTRLHIQSGPLSCGGS